MYFLRFKLLPTLIGLIFTATAGWLYISQSHYLWNIINRINQVSYDLNLKSLKTTPKISDDLIVIKIDEKSLEQVGRWPWPRSKIADLISKLHKNGVSVVSLDIIFSEVEKNIIDKIRKHITAIPKKQLTRLHKKFDNDTLLEKSLAAGDSALSFVLTTDDTHVGTLPEPLFILADDQNPGIYKMSGYIAALNKFSKSATSNGFISYFRDSDGSTRRVPLLLKYRDKVYPSLALDTVRLFLLHDSATLKITADANGTHHIDGVQLGNYIIPTDNHAQVLAPFNNIKDIPTLSAADVLSNNIKRKQVEGKIALIGFTAKGLTDLVATPISIALPGVFVHASIINGILTQHFYYSPSWSAGAEFTVLIIIGLFLTLLLPWLGPLWQTINTLLATFAVLALDWLSWNHFNWIFDIGLIIFLIACISTFNLLYGFLFEQRLRKKFKKLFGTYVPPDHVRSIVRKTSKEQKILEGETKNMTVLFSDIRNFTNLSEKLTANKVKQMLNEFLTPMTDTILKNNGTIDKYIGDAIMAFWGAPLDNKNHANDAIKAAFAMIEGAKDISEQFKKESLPEFKIGIGINSGDMDVGDMGSEYRRSYTVLGDNVNLASRLEAMTKYYQVPIIVGENTENEATDYHFKLLDYIKVYGKDNAVKIYQPICEKENITGEQIKEIEDFKAALDQYLAGEWNNAIKHFTKLVNNHPDVYLYTIYLERSDKLKDQPRTPWDGCYERRTK